MALKILTPEEVIDIGNEAHRAMPPDADDQEELLLIAEGIIDLVIEKMGLANMEIENGEKRNYS